MSLRQCCSFLSKTCSSGKITRNLITRFISGDNKQNLSKNSNLTNVKILNPNISSEHKTANNGGYRLEPSDNSNQNANALLVRTRQQSVIVTPKEEFLDDEDIVLPKPLDKCTEDVSDIGPYLSPTFTFAKYANVSRTIQELTKLGVKLYLLESKEGMVQYILGLDFEQDVKPYITFLHDCGVPADYLGDFITKNPNIFKVDMDDLYTRIRYLRAHNFNVDMIKTIICKNPMWLQFNTKDIDGRLAYFQSTFKLSGNNIRLLTVKGPKVITYKMLHLMENTFSIKEEMGFDKNQIKNLLLALPRIWVKNRTRLLNVFDYAYNKMQLQHDLIVKHPHILLCRKTRLEHRHLFLVELKRAQYDPTKPLYISPQALISGTDIDFCRNIAKTSVEVFNTFLKTF